MWELVSTHNSYGIQAKSYRSKEDPVIDCFSVGIFFGSFESRGLESSKLLPEASCENSLIILFRENDNMGLRERYDRELLSVVSKCSINEPIIIKNKSINDVEAIINEIISKIPTHSFSKSAKWFIDTTASPKPYFLGILGYLRTKMENPHITLFNATGDYEKIQNEQAFSFTEGTEKYIWIPWVWGQPDPRLPWTYIFLLGFEGDRSYGTYDRFEPLYVKAMIADPGYRANYPQIARERNKQFLDEASPDLIHADAGDAVEAWVKIDECLLGKRYDTNVCIVSLGPKPHAIGGCLSALTDGFPAMMYLLPKSFKARDVARGDYVWKYEITL